MFKSRKFIGLYLSLAFLAAICFALSFGFSFSAPAAADDGLSVTAVEQVYLQPYNSAKDGRGYRSNYIITFDSQVASGSVGDNITDTMKNGGVFDKIKFNGNTLGEINDASETVTFFKYDDNAVELQISRPIYYASIEFESGLTVNGKTLSSAVTFYENEDWSFDTAKPEYRIFAIGENPYYNPGKDVAGVNLTLTEKPSATDGGYSQYDLITFTNSLYKDAKYNTEAHIGAGNVTGWHTFGEKSINGLGIRLNFWYDEFPDYTEMKIAAGFLGITKDQIFFMPGGKDHSSTGWENMPRWTEKKGTTSVQLSFKERGADYTSYSLKFTNVDNQNAAVAEDMLSAYAEGDDIGKFITRMTSIPESVNINGAMLSNTNNVTYKKGGANEIIFVLPGDVRKPGVSMSVGLHFAGYVSLENYLFVGNDDDTFSSVSTTVDDKTSVDVEGIKTAVSYGYSIGKTQTRFSIYFSDLGIFNGTASGSEISSYLTESNFFDKVKVNGRTLTSIKATRQVNVYRGNMDGYFATNPEVVDGAIEIVISSAALFDYEVEIDKDLIIGNVAYVGDNVSYRKGLDESFSVIEEEEETKVIAFRERPYYSAVGSRCFCLIYNKEVKTAAPAEIFNGMTFNGKTLRKDLGGMYFNPETEYGGRSYTIYINENDFNELITSDEPQITIPSVTLTDGTKTKEQTLVNRTGIWQDIDDETVYPEADVEVRLPGNQSLDEKLFAFVFNYGISSFTTVNWLINNIYMNGTLISTVHYSANYANPEINYNCMQYVVYINDNLRNYDGGADVLYIPKGCPLAAGVYIMKDLYFYGTMDTEVRDAAYNFKWTFTQEKPALEVLKGDKVDMTGDEVSATIRFRNIVAKNDVLFGKYDEKDVSSFIKFNDKTLADYGADARYEWVDDGIKVIFKKSVLTDDDKYLSFLFLDGFTTPLGLEIKEDSPFVYDLDNRVWGYDFSPLEIENQWLRKNRVSNVSAPKIMREGIWFSIKFVNTITGGTRYVGAIDGIYDRYYTWFPNITKPFDELLEITETLAKVGDLRGAGYDYNIINVQRLIRLGVREDILDKLSFNDKTVRELIAEESAEAIESSALQIDLDGDCINVFVKRESVLYAMLKDGITVKVGEGMTFDSGYYQGEDQSFDLDYGIKATATKTDYAFGEELDIETITLNYVFDGKTGDEIEITPEMISGYDKNKSGNQAVTVRCGKLTATLKVNVAEDPNGGGDEPVTPPASDDPTPADPENGGCGGCSGSIGTFGGMSLFFICLAAVGLILVKARKNRD